MLLNILVYLLTLLIFYLFTENDIRFLLSIVAYFSSCYIFRVSKYKSILYLFLAMICVLTESFFINCFKDTWIYGNSDILGIPLWLIPLWAIAIVLILNIEKDMENIIGYIKKFL